MALFFIVVFLPLLFSSLRIRPRREIMIPEYSTEFTQPLIQNRMSLRGVSRAALRKRIQEGKLKHDHSSSHWPRQRLGGSVGELWPKEGGGVGKEGGGGQGAEVQGGVCGRVGEKALFFAFLSGTRSST